MDATEALRRAARLWPDRQAVVSGGGSLTFGELDRQVNRVARFLLRCGIRHGDRVATFLPNSAEHVVAEMAVLRAGAAWVAINRRLAPPEVAFMVEHAGVAAILHDGASVPDLATQGAARAYDVGGTDAAFARALAAESDAPPEVALHEHDVARLRYTSGTTGNPKAAVLTHRSAISSLRNLLGELHELGPDDVVAHVAPLTHASEALLAPAFWRGARTIVLPRFDPAELVATIARERVTVLFLVPTMIAALADEPRAVPGALASLRTVLYGAAPIGTDLLARALELFGPVLLQIYGLSECPFPVTTLQKLDHLDPRRRGSCGSPTALAEIRILDPGGAPLGPGEVGQIAIRAPQMMREYWRDPEATREALVDGWLRTGDLGCSDDAGFLTLVDRSDDVIISGGFNVYPREVEIALEAHPAVCEAAVAAVPHPRWGQGVGAWVVRHPGTETSPQALIEFCRTRLAGYKKPVEITFVTELPRSATGKLLRRLLRERG